ncbi:MAG: hypothetical protein ACFFAJ_04300 [Candidatus Hodarchaeota archaeon]
MINSKSTDGTNILNLSLTREQGWNETTASEFASLIANLTPDEAITGLKAAKSLRPSAKTAVGRPKAYLSAWIKLQNNLISLEEFETIVHRQLIDNEIKKDTYYRAMRKAKKFIEHRNRTVNLDKLQSYEEVWIAFHSNQLNWDEFKTNLEKLKQHKRISEVRYQHAISEGKRVLKIRKYMIEMTKNQ